MQTMFLFKNHEVEVLELNGQALFNPYHVGECLGISTSTMRDNMAKMNERQVIKLTNPDVDSIDIRKLNNAGENFLTESGVYKLVFRSRKPEAEEFTNWVTDEVLPQIRKTGGYIPTHDHLGNELTDAEIMAKALLIAQKTLKEREKQLTDAVDKIKRLEPKAEYYDNVLNAEGTVTTTDIAKYDYGMTATELNRLLCLWHIQYKNHPKGRYYLYSKYSGYGYIASKETFIKHKDGTIECFPYMVWTQLGRKFIHEQMKKHGFLTTVEQKLEWENRSPF